MTGHGLARAEGKELAVEVEIRTVNHRFVAVQMKLPGELGSLEPEIEASIRKRLHRGAVAVSAQVLRRGSALAEATVHLEQARAVVAGLRRLARELKLSGEISLTDVAAAPGVLGGGSKGTDSDGRVCGLALRAVNDALDRVIAAREREGAALARELRARIASMSARVDELEARAPQAVAEHHERLRRRLAEILEGTRASLREEDLAREVALLAERSDVAEEIARLRAHLEEAEALLHRAEPVGRRLDFLIQEVQREVNTLGSKSTDTAMTRAALDLKADVDRVREQSANLE
jgi:uncharacterized protein (TIGR00255 family)